MPRPSTTPARTLDGTEAIAVDAPAGTIAEHTTPDAIQAFIGALFTSANTQIGGTQPTDPSILFWFDGTVVVAGDLVRSSTGLIMYDDFTSGSLAAWTTSGTAAIVTDGGKNVLSLISGTALLPITSDATFFGQMKARNPLGDIAETRGLDLVSGADKYEYITWASTGWAFYDGTTLTQGTGDISGTDYTVVSLAASGSGVKCISSGALDMTMGNTNLTSFDGIRVVEGTTDGCYVTKIAAMKDSTIICTGIPTGYKLRVGGVVVTESGGTATLDVSLLEFPQSLVEVLTDADVVDKSISLANDVWGGDVYAY